MTTKRRFSISVDAATLERLDEMSDASGIPRSHLIERAIQLYLNRNATAARERARRKARNA